MKSTLSTLIITGVAVSALAAFAGAALQDDTKSCCGGGTMAMSPQGQKADKPLQAKQLKDKQVATILINGGYKPGAVEVKVGKPVELTFTGGKNIGCGGTVVFKSLKISKDVTTGKSIVIKFTPKEKGEIQFTCGMNMYRGKVIVS